MEEFSAQTQSNAVDGRASVVLDINSLAQHSEKCSGSPKMTKMLSRKNSNRMEKQIDDDLEPDDTSKRIVVKVGANMASLTDAGDGRSKRLIRLRLIHPRNVLLLFATMSSMGTMLLIYFTLAIKP